jgi:hypothetical protein
MGIERLGSVDDVDGSRTSQTIVAIMETRRRGWGTDGSMANLTWLQKKSAVFARRCGKRDGRPLRITYDQP